MRFSHSYFNHDGVNLVVKIWIICLIFRHNIFWHVEDMIPAELKKLRYWSKNATQRAEYGFRLCKILWSWLIDVIAHKVIREKSSVLLTVDPACCCFPSLCNGRWRVIKSCRMETTRWQSQVGSRFFASPVSILHSLRQLPFFFQLQWQVYTKLKLMFTSSSSSSTSSFTVLHLDDKEKDWVDLARSITAGVQGNRWPMRYTACGGGQQWLWFLIR